MKQPYAVLIIVIFDPHSVYAHEAKIFVCLQHGTKVTILLLLGQSQLDYHYPSSAERA